MKNYGTIHQKKNNITSYLATKNLTEIKKKKSEIYFNIKSYIEMTTTAQQNDFGDFNDRTL